MNHVSKGQTSKEDTNPSGPDGGSEYCTGDTRRKRAFREERQQPLGAGVHCLCMGWGGGDLGKTPYTKNPEEASKISQ